MKSSIVHATESINSVDVQVFVEAVIHRTDLTRSLVVALLVLDIRAVGATLYLVDPLVVRIHPLLVVRV